MKPLSANEYVKYVRRRLGLTQKELARRLGLKRSTFANYEVNVTVPGDLILELQRIEKSEIRK